MKKRCLVCDNSEGLMCCSRCKQATYCSAEHQKADWKRHRQECGKPLREGDVSDGSKVKLTDFELERAFTAEHFHQKDSKYWSSAPRTDDGMLGGLEKEVASLDVEDSLNTLSSLILHTTTQQPQLQTNLALDCGAGIGRVTRDVLSKVFRKVDLVEQQKPLIEKATENLSSLGVLGECFCSSLQEFIVSKNSYDLIWIQWVVLYLSDSELVTFLKRCKEGLKNNNEEGGSLIIVKDNVTRNGRFFIDVQDGSLIRTESHMLELFSAANLHVLQSKYQQGLPSELFPVITFILK